MTLFSSRRSKTQPVPPLFQIFYFICAGSLNNLLLRKDMCHWSKGMQIRYNLSHLEQWTRDMRLHEAGVTDTLAPIIQAAQLLQARKTDDDVNSICDMCDKLSVSQVGARPRGQGAGALPLRISMLRFFVMIDGDGNNDYDK